MKQKKKRKNKTELYINAVKKADREISLENSTGFSANTTVCKNKKKYDRNANKVNKNNIDKYID